VEGHGFSHVEKRHHEVGRQAWELSVPQRLKADFFFACLYGTPEGVPFQISRVYIRTTRTALDELFREPVVLLQNLTQAVVR